MKKYIMSLILVLFCFSCKTPDYSMYSSPQKGSYLIRVLNASKNQLHGQITSDGSRNQCLSIIKDSSTVFYVKDADYYGLSLWNTEYIYHYYFYEPRKYSDNSIWKIDSQMNILLMDGSLWDEAHSAPPQNIKSKTIRPFASHKYSNIAPILQKGFK